MRIVWPFLIGSMCLAQTPAPSFDVASVKLDVLASQPRRPGEPSREAGPGCSGGRLVSQAILLRRLLAWAYDISPINTSGIPKWAEYGSPEAYYDIQATSGVEVDAKQCKLMVRALLAERFGLIVRRETVGLPVYALIVGKNGPKLRAVPDPSEPGRAAGINGRKIAPDTGRTGPWSMPHTLTAMRVANRQVVDRTGLTGVYEFNLIYDEFEDAPFSRHDLPDMRAAVEEQLGLKLEERREPLETLVVVRLERPSEN
jgi:uncharacterized protein (TIGR03435 family)